MGGIFGFGPVSFARERAGENFLRLWIQGSGETEIVRRGPDKNGWIGSVLARQVVEEGIADEKGTALIPTASRDSAASESRVVRVTKHHENERRI